MNKLVICVSFYENHVRVDSHWRGQFRYKLLRMRHSFKNRSPPNIILPPQRQVTKGTGGRSRRHLRKVGPKTPKGFRGAGRHHLQIQRPVGASWRWFSHKPCCVQEHNRCFSPYRGTASFIWKDHLLLLVMQLQEGLSRRRKGGRKSPVQMVNQKYKTLVIGGKWRLLSGHFHVLRAAFSLNRYDSIWGSRGILSKDREEGKHMFLFQ